MTKFELEKFHIDFCISARYLMLEKNDAYAYGDDVFRNLRRHGVQGIVVRMDDKLARLESMIEGGKVVACSESLRDTATDIINYAVLFIALAEEQAKDAKTDE